MNTPSTSNDPLLTALAGLPVADPDVDRDDRIRRRCHSLIAAQRRGPSHRRTTPVPRPIESAVVGAFGLLYLVAILANAARAYGL